MLGVALGMVPPAEWAVASKEMGHGMDAVLSGRDGRMRGWLLALRRFVLLFAAMAFVLTCCMLLFLNTLIDTTGVSWSHGQLELAARLTFANVVALSVIGAVADGIRRRLVVDRPIRRIGEVADRIAMGDFSARVPAPVSRWDDGGFSVIGERINAMAEELGGMETLRSDFIANVSHELKTPLSVIQSYGKLLQRPGLDEERRIEYARVIAETSGDLATLVTNILKLNKLENQRIYPTTEPYDLGEQLRGCLLGFEKAWEAKQLDVDVDVQDDVMVDADAELLSLVWNNLFSNAIKFTDPHGRIRLHMYARDGRAVVRVDDTGCGIDSETGRHIFEKFYQGDTSHAVQGNGLGLALVKRVVDIIGGDIDVSSEVGVGSAFTVTLRCMP